MTGLRNDIEALRRELAHVSQTLERQLQAIDEDASRRRRSALAEADAAKAELSLKLARLMIAETMLGDNPSAVVSARQTAAMSGQERKTAAQVILETLAASPGSLPFDALAKAVVDTGWTRSAAEKSKTRLYASGCVVRDAAGAYTITEKGVERMNGG